MFRTDLDTVGGIWKGLSQIVFRCKCWLCGYLKLGSQAFLFLLLLICFVLEHSAGRVMMQCVPSAAICLMFEISSDHNA